MEESAPDVVLAQDEDTSLAVGLCVSLSGGAGHQKILILHPLGRIALHLPDIWMSVLLPKI